MWYCRDNVNIQENAQICACVSDGWLIEIMFRPRYLLFLSRIAVWSSEVTFRSRVQCFSRLPSTWLDSAKSHGSGAMRSLFNMAGRIYWAKWPCKHTHLHRIKLYDCQHCSKTGGDNITVFHGGLGVREPANRESNSPSRCGRAGWSDGTLCNVPSWLCEGALRFNSVMTSLFSKEYLWLSVKIWFKTDFTSFCWSHGGIVFARLATFKDCVKLDHRYYVVFGFGLGSPFFSCCSQIFQGGKLLVPFSFNCIHWVTHMFTWMFKSSIKVTIFSKSTPTKIGVLSKL